ncbi:DUF5908 family protein [Desulfobulbus propionicus]
MSIEIRQLLIKSTIDETEQGQGQTVLYSNLEQDRQMLKNEILAACRDLVTELLQRQKER